jgi:hypothetical protein
MNIMNNEKRIDKLELNTFIIYLYFYVNLYSFIVRYSYFRIFFITISSNIFSYYYFNYNTLTFVCHLYWRNNIKEIAMPQLISCLSNIIIYRNEKSVYSYFLYFITFLTINFMYINEIKESRNSRFFLMLFYFFLTFVF